jgi:ribosomal protein S18 acetylase RimI-like enzyme
VCGLRACTLIMRAMILRLATPDDADALASVHVRSWQAAYADILPHDYLAGLSIGERSAWWRGQLVQATAFTLVAERAHVVVAFVTCGPCRDEGAPPGRAEIYAFYADPTAWGSGVGKPLMEGALDALARAGYGEVTLWVMSENRRGRRFYERAGFSAVEGSATTFGLAGVTVEEVAYGRRVPLSGGGER